MLDNYLDELSRATRANGSKNCPNCGAPIETEKCPYCGTIFLDFAATEPNVIYDTFGSRLLTLIPTSSLTLDFDILN